MNQSNDRRKDLATAAFGFLLAHVSFWSLGKFGISVWILKFLVYAGGFTFLIYIVRLKTAAEGIYPESRQAFKEYLKLGSVYCVILFTSEIHAMLSVI